MARRQKQPKEGIGKRIADLRQEKGMTQDELAAALHMGRSALNMRERGERSLTAEDAVQIARFFGITTDELLCGVKSGNVGINDATGLSDAAIEALRVFHGEDETGENAAAISRALSSQSFLNALAELLQVRSDERGFHLAYLSPEGGLYKPEMSPDALAAILRLRICDILERIRTQEAETQSPYAPNERREAAEIEKLRSEGRLTENGGDK